MKEKLIKNPDEILRRLRGYAVLGKEQILVFGLLPAKTDLNVSITTGRQSPLLARDWMRGGRKA